MKIEIHEDEIKILGYIAVCIVLMLTLSKCDPIKSYPNEAAAQKEASNVSNN